MKKIKLPVTRYNLTRFFFFAEENEINFNGNYQIFNEAIYITEGVVTNLSWSEAELNDKEIKIVVSMLNLLIKSHKLYYKEEEDKNER